MKKVTVNGNDCTTKEDLFNTFSEEFDFPDYFARTWDSFDEIMCDLSWIEEEKIELQIVDYQNILINEPDDELDTFYEIISNIEEYSGKTFLVNIDNES